jgi:hypothetical protein
MMNTFTAPIAMGSGSKFWCISVIESKYQMAWGFHIEEHDPEEYDEDEAMQDNQAEAAKIYDPLEVALTRFPLDIV